MQFSFFVTVILQNQFTVLEKHLPMLWTVGDMNQARKFERLMYIEDVKEALMPPGEFGDEFEWLEEWTVPFRNAIRTCPEDKSLLYREGFLPVVSNKKYEPLEIGEIFHEFLETPVSRFFHFFQRYAKITKTVHVFSGRHAVREESGFRFTRIRIGLRRLHQIIVGYLGGPERRS
jgi:hypothetical protein